jgi:hypothetical protein
MRGVFTLAELFFERLRGYAQCVPFQAPYNFCYTPFGS